MKTPSDSKPAKKAATKVAKKAATKKAKGTVAGTPTEGSGTAATSEKRGAVLIPRTIKQIKAFIGNDENVVIYVSKKSLVDAHVSGARKAAAKLLEEDNDDLV